VTSDGDAQHENAVEVVSVPSPRFGVVASGGLSLLLSSSLIVLFPLGMLVAPLALIPVTQHVVSGRRSVFVWGWVVALLALATLGGASLFGLPILAHLLVFVFMVVLPTVSLELWLSTGVNEGRWATITVLSGSVLCMATLFAFASPGSPLTAIGLWWQQAAVSLEEAYEAAGVASGQLDLALDTVEWVVPWVLPGFPVAYLMVILFWIRPRLAVLGFGMPVAPFEDFRMDEWLPAAFAVAGIGTLVSYGTARWVAVNLLIAVLLLYFVQGLAIIRAHLARWIGRGWLVRWGVVLLCLQGPLPLVVAALGMADGFYSLRPRIVEDGGEA
jgi:hypothetical protein